jgi:4-amino-4-deoxy-L-arabinose transferase-like glycosyltransferase
VDIEDIFSSPHLKSSVRFMSLMLKKIHQIWWETPAGIALPLLALLVISCYFSFSLFKHFNFNDDIPSYIFAADTFALGKLKVPIPVPDDPVHRTSPDDPSFFRTWMVVPATFDDVDENGKKYQFMYSRYPPGHAFTLFIGKQIFRTYHVVPVVLVLLSAIGIYGILRLTEGERAARWALILMPLSPFFVAYGNSLLSHCTTFFFLTYATWLYILMDRAQTNKRRAVFGFVAAFLYSMALTCRPLAGVAFILGVIIWEFRHVVKNRATILVRWTSMGVGGGIVVACLLGYNAQVTGKPLQFAFDQYWPRDMLGFTGTTELSTDGWTTAQKESKLNFFKGEDAIGTTKMRYKQHTPLLGVFNFLIIFERFDRWFLVVPHALMICLLLLFALRKSLSSYLPFYMLQVSLVCVMQFFYFSYGSLTWGPRYYYECLLPAFLLLAPLCAIALRKLQDFKSRKAHSLLKSPASRAAVGLLICAVFLAVVVDHVMKTSFFARNVESWARDEREKVWQNVQAKVKKPALVFLRPQVNDKGRYCGHFDAHLLNNPTFDGEIIYAINWGKQNGRLVQLHPHRNLYELTLDGRVIEKKPSDYP